MKILGIVFKIFKELYNAVGPDIKNKKAVVWKELLSNQYLHWAPKLQADEALLTDVVRAFLFMWFLCLILILTILKLLISEKHLVYAMISSDGAFVFYLLFFGCWTIEHLKRDLLRISKSFLKLFTITFVIFNILTFALTAYSARSVASSELIINSDLLFISAWEACSLA